MRRLLFILILSVATLSCVREDEQPSHQVEYTYNLEGWESLGSQTLVMLEANNASLMDQQFTLKVEIVNVEGKIFSKDTTIEFNKSEREKSFQMIIDTEGEIKDVKVYSIQ